MCFKNLLSKNLERNITAELVPLLVMFDHV